MARSLTYGLAILLALGQATTAQDVITEDSYFYGLSPPVYPSPQGTGAGDWTDAYTKATALVGQLTLEEKVNLTGGVETTTGCTGFIPAITRVGFPGLCLTDAGNGLRWADYVSAWASGWSVGASWNRDLAHQRAVGMAHEFRKKGSNIALGPVVGPLGRIASGGRNWEGFSSDPYLCGQLGYETIAGMSSTGIIASVKHFIANEQETYRYQVGNISSVSSNVDDKTMHEQYLWPFQDAVKAGAGSVLCSYNRVNNSYACQNSYTQNGILKTELGFQGFVLSDWDGQHTGVDSALAGLDMAMPLGSDFWGLNLTEAVTNGSVPESRVNDMATRIIAAWYQMGQDSEDWAVPGHGIPADLAAPHTRVIGWNASYKDTLWRGALEGHVLVKNEGALPLKDPQLISVFGYSAKTPDTFNYGLGWYNGQYPLAPSDYTKYANGSVYSSSIAVNGTIISGGGSGANQPAYISSPFSALTERARVDMTELYWNLHDSNPEVDATSDACIVDVNAYAAESYDRPELRDDYTDDIILNVAANCSNTIVVFQNAGTRLVDQFIDHPNVTALIFANVPGQDSGSALVALLYGDENFSGKMQYTLARNETDYDGLQNATLPDGIYALFPQSDFSEGVYHDYRAFDAKNITPRYEFGFGLSYTTFSFSDLTADLAGGNASTASYPTGPVVPGGQADLWDVLATVTANVTNTGSVKGAEVAQLYVGIPGGPVRQLRGFEKPVLEPGESATVSFPLTRRDLSTWDTVAQKWLLQKGDYPVYVGSSSRKLPLTGKLTI